MNCILSRKLLVAVITSFIGFFIVPVFFNYGPNEYLLVGLGVGIVAVPYIFVGGIISSLLIEHFGKRQQWWLSYLKHIGSSLICVAVFLLYELINNGQPIVFAEIALIISFIYTTIFFITDSILKKKSKSIVL